VAQRIARRIAGGKAVGAGTAVAKLGGMTRALGIVGVASALVALVGCGGSVSVVGDGGDNGTDGGGSGSGSGGSTSSDAGPCPSALPTDGSPCNNDGLTCEYGGSAVQGCDTVAACNAQLRVWKIQSPTLVDCGSSSPTCPLAYASVPQGAACTNNGAVCDYDQGRCECASGGGPIRLIDGSPGTFWFCQDPRTTGCPSRRPALGSTCAGNLTCDYGTCSVEGGTAEGCISGTWVPAFVGCPL
jgi:hypothetical protein